MPLYKNFVSEFASKINQLYLVQYLCLAARTLPSPQESLAFLQDYAKKLQEKKDYEKDAFVLATMEAAHYRLLTGDTEGCTQAIKACEPIIDEHSDTTINASFYRVSADYYKAKAMYPQYYHNALLFLSSVSMDDLATAEHVERAHDLAISAILGDGLYNFGELVRILVSGSAKLNMYS